MQVRDYNDDMDCGHFALAFEGLSWTDPDVFTLMLSQSLIGTYDIKRGGAQFSSAKLASELSKLDTGVQQLQPFCTCYNDTGLFGVYFTSTVGKKEARRRQSAPHVHVHVWLIMFRIMRVDLRSRVCMSISMYMSVHVPCPCP